MIQKACIHLCTLFSLLFFVAPLSYGQPFGGAEAEFVRAKGVISVDKAPSGGKFQAAVIASISKGYHVNANKPTSNYLIPTKLEFDEQTGLSIGEVVYPEPLKKKYEFSKEELAIYQGQIILCFDVTVSKELPLGNHTINCKLGYQACNDAGQCFMPKTIPVSISFEVVSAGRAVSRINKEVFSHLELGATSDRAEGHTHTQETDVKTASVSSLPKDLKQQYDIKGVPTIVFIDSQGAERKDLRIVGFVEPDELLATMKHAMEGTTGDQKGKGSDVARLVEEVGYLVTLAIIFMGGLALNLTPCVYPIIPITISYFGGQSEGRPRKVFVLACSYVLGMAITYSALGVFAALSGEMFGSWLQNPLLLVFVAGLLVALALSMFGLYEFRMPNFLVSKSRPRHGLFGALFMGLIMGAVAAPCIGPFVLGLITFVANTGDPFLGFLMFFTLAMGLGLPYIFLGTFSGSINALPKSGVWMVWIKKIFGFLLIGMALYFLKSLPGISRVFWILVGILGVVAGVYLGWLEGSASGSRGFYWLRKAVGVLVVAAGLWAMIPAHKAREVADTEQAVQSGEPGVTDQGGVAEMAWAPYQETELQDAAQNGKPVMIDFFADWCMPCKELDKYTFRDPEVVKQSESFVALKADLTRAF